MSSLFIRRLKLAGFAAAVIATPAVACGPFFPNQLLFSSGQSLTWAPVADFRREIERIAPAQATVHSLQPDHQSVFEQTSTIDLADLKAALAELHLPGAEQAAMLREYEKTRHALAEHARSVSDAKEKGDGPAPVLSDVSIPQGLPPEFELYVSGVLYYYRNQMAEARSKWEVLLNLPPEQRRRRTVWAQFMIAKSYLHDDPPRAVEAFQRVRELVKQGEADSLGLAAASFGWEARAQLNEHHESQAIELYLQQFATGDPGTVESLAMVCDAMAKHGEPGRLRELAQDPLVARVMTAYALAQGFSSNRGRGGTAVAAWLGAIEASPAVNVVGADRLAWAAYQSGEMDMARRWLSRAEQSPLALWVNAKLLLRAGNMDVAADALARAVRGFPEDEKWSGVPGAYEAQSVELSPRQRAQAELGVLQLSRGQYVQSLDQLFKAGWWLDAAYVAERVLTEDELIAYMKRWPDGTAANLRHLLARRLTRSGRWKEARPYFPAELRPKLDQYIAAIRNGHEMHLSAEERAQWLWEAAKISRRFGMQLLGTELTPDDFADDGSFRGSTVLEAREKTKDDPFGPTREELQRAGQSGPRPGNRWHYRYIATDHAWAAAQLMPDGTDALAALLCEAGGWIKSDDPRSADRFYKALVTRCPNTALGKEAARRKWFPDVKFNK